MSFPIYRGNCPRSVSKDAKYTVRNSNKGPIVAIIYETLDDERWYPTTDQHPQLVKMVNDVKLSFGAPPNGSFYINEYKQVIVPVSGRDEYYYAGKYETALRFNFEGKILSGEAMDLVGDPLSPGDRWVGPHTGIPYVLTAGGQEIRFTVTLRPGVEKDFKLSKAIGTEKAKPTIDMIRAVKGFSGGKFYVNEFCSVFAPVTEEGEVQYIYIGKLNLDSWFPCFHDASV